MSESPLTDEQLAELAEKQGLRAVYVAGWDLAIERVREDGDRNRDFIESVHSILRQMGFAPLGLSREQEILHALQVFAEQRAK